MADALGAEFFNALTIVVALVVVLLGIFMRWKRGQHRILAPNRITVDFLNGATVVPFIIIIGSTFSRDLASVLISQHSLMFALAGMVGLFFMFEEIYKSFLRD